MGRCEALSASAAYATQRLAAKCRRGTLIDCCSPQCDVTIGNLQFGGASQHSSGDSGSVPTGDRKTDFVGPRTHGHKTIAHAARPRKTLQVSLWPVQAHLAVRLRVWNWLLDVSDGPKYPLAAFAITIGERVGHSGPVRFRNGKCGRG